MIHRNSNDLHFHQITTLLRRRWSFLTLVVLLGGGAAAVLGYSLPPSYTAKAQLLYQMEAQDGSETIDEAAVDTLVEMLISPSHLRRLTKSLEEDPGEGGVVPPLLREYASLDEGLNVYKERKSRLVAITFKSPDPEAAALVANRVVELYLDLEASLQREARTRALDSVAARIPDALAKIDQAEGALREHRIKYGLNNTSGSDPIDRQIGELSRQLSVAQSDLHLHEAQLDDLRGRRFVDSGGANGNLGDQVRLAARADSEDTENDALALFRKTPDPETRRATLDRDAAAARLGDIERRLAALQEASAKMTGAWIRLRELEREASAAGLAYENLLRRKADLQAQNIVRPAARLVTSAVVPNSPSSPNPLLFVAPAVIASLLIGGMLAILFERLDRRLRSERNVEESLGTICIGLVPRIWRREIAALPRLMRTKPFAPYTEAIRSVFVAATQRSAQSILVTSSVRGEGKTTLVLGLAVFAAGLGKRVLAIDLDLRDPQLLRLLDGGGQKTRFASGGAAHKNARESMIRRSEKYGIDYLSLPRTGRDPLTVLANEDFPALLKQLRQTYDCILIDSAPVIGATETRLLASMVDRVLFTVRWGVTEAETAIPAVQLLRATGTEHPVSISTVVTRVKPGAHRRRRYSEPAPMLPVAG
ncbi:GumC family protein [Puniceibacterium confluentis]|uniref:GumC family protein n=1 Tax=Puniceibacterium confluentis TaxID=1958944 RepID=UPI0011B73588|nr:polysaccharide biosynthesis tyrosine autokinase [Puniceibacterium confluentis]